MPIYQNLTNYYKMKIISDLGNRGGYFAPSIEIVELFLERGFVVSGTGSAGWENGSEENDLGNF